MMPLNLDANASYGLIPEVRSWLAGQAEDFLNPSSIHRGGQRSRALIEEARLEILRVVHAGAGDRLVFTSGATEANNMVLAGVCAALEAAARPERVSLCVSNIEHPSIRVAARRLCAAGFSLSFVKVTAHADVQQLVSQVPAGTSLLSLMLANNETGQILPVAELAAELHRSHPGILIHCDAAQALGRMEVDFNALGVDYLSLSAHKCGGLSGTGALVCRADSLLESLILGGAQEGKLRAGTENTAGIVSFGIAARAASDGLPQRLREWLSVMNVFSGRVFSRLDGVSRNCSVDSCLPNTLSLRIDRVPADALVVALDLEGILASAGSACSSGKPEPSAVLMAMGLSEREARESLRISSRADLTEGEAIRAADILVDCAQRIRRRG